MSDDKIQTTGLYVVRLVQHLNDMQYYIETHRILETANPISDLHRIGRADLRWGFASDHADRGKG